MSGSRNQPVEKRVSDGRIADAVFPYADRKDTSDNYAFTAIAGSFIYEL